MLDSIVRLWAFSSASKSQMLVPASTLGSPVTAPVLTSSLSANVVFPEPPWPQSAMLRMSSTLYLDMKISLICPSSVVSGQLLVGGSQGVRERELPFIQRPADDAPRDSDRRQPAHVVRRRHATGSDYIRLNRGVHFGQRVKIRPCEHAVASNIGVDNCC